MRLPDMLNDKNLCKVRTITTFLTLDSNKNKWAERIKKANDFCQSLAADLNNNGYTVQSIRIVTNAFAEYIDVTTLQTAQADLRVLNALLNPYQTSGLRLRFAIGEATDAHQLSLVPELIKEFGDLCNICVNIAQDENGVLDNKLIENATHAVNEISKITSRGEGNFNFTVNFNCKPLIPYFPASYFDSTACDSFVIGLETPDLLTATLTAFNEANAINANTTDTNLTNVINANTTNANATNVINANTTDTNVTNTKATNVINANTTNTNTTNATNVINANATDTNVTNTKTTNANANPTNVINADTTNTHATNVINANTTSTSDENINGKRPALDHQETFDGYYQALSRQLQFHVDQLKEIIDAAHLDKGFQFAGLDSSAAPSKSCASMTEVYELLGVEYFGASGTVEASALLTRVFKSLSGIPLVGFSGLMLALTEDRGLAKGSQLDHFDIRALLTYSAVCGIGLDTVPIPGDTPQHKISALMRDTGTMAFRLNKPLTVRLFPVPGLQAGEMTEFESEDLCNCAVLAVP